MFLLHNSLYFFKMEDVKMFGPYVMKVKKEWKLLLSKKGKQG